MWASIFVTLRKMGFDKKEMKRMSFLELEYYLRALETAEEAGKSQ
jgi:hypothetical protein